MQDHNFSPGRGTSNGTQSVGQSNSASFPPLQSAPGLDPCRPWGSFIERAFVYVDCCFARNGYHGRAWSNQLKSECEQRHQDFLKVQAARSAFGEKVIPHGLILRSLLIVIFAGLLFSTAGRGGAALFFAKLNPPTMEEM